MDILQSAQFWVAVAFFGLIALCFKPLSRMLLGALDSRADGINQEISEAARLVEEAQALFADYQKKQREAAGECEAIISYAREQADRLHMQAADDLKQTLEARERQALARIAQAETEAIQAVRDRAADIAVAATRELLAAQLSAKDKTGLISAAVKEIPQRLH